MVVSKFSSYYWLWLTLDILWCASHEIPTLYSSRIDGLLMPYDQGSW